MEMATNFPSLFFLTVTLLAVLLVFKVFNNSKIAILISFAWLTLQGIVSLTGFYFNGELFPFRFPLLLGPPLLFSVIYTIAQLRRPDTFSQPLKWVVLTHVIRIPVEIVLYALYTEGNVPEMMTFEGSNPDILSGITAPIVWYLYEKGRIGKATLIGWNVVCLGLLANIVGRAILTVPSPFQQFVFDKPDLAVQHFPFIFLPCYIVPVVLLCHLNALVQLTRSSGIHEKSN